MGLLHWISNLTARIMRASAGTIPAGTALHAWCRAGLEAEPEPGTGLRGHDRASSREASGLAARFPWLADQTLQGLEGLPGQLVVEFADLLRTR